MYFKVVLVTRERYFEYVFGRIIAYDVLVGVLGGKTFLYRVGFDFVADKRVTFDEVRYVFVRPVKVFNRAVYNEFRLIRRRKRKPFESSDHVGSQRIIADKPAAENEIALYGNVIGKRGGYGFARTDVYFRYRKRAAFGLQYDGATYFPLGVIGRLAVEFTARHGAARKRGIGVPAVEEKAFSRRIGGERNFAVLFAA